MTVHFVLLSHDMGLLLQEVFRPPVVNGVDTLHSDGNRELPQGQKLTSRNQAHELCMQGDGNLVHYNGGRAVWSSGTCNIGSGPYCLVLQEDRNLVVYGQNGSVIWTTNTHGRGTGPARLVMQDDDNLVIYGGNGRVIWARR